MRLTEPIFDEVIKGVTVAVVGKLVVRRREFLEALCRDGSKIAFKLSILDENHRATTNEAVDQILLSHFVPKRREKKT